MNYNILSKFGIRLRQLRVERGLSQEELAYRGNFNRNYIGMVERGERNPSLKTLERMARSLDITLRELLDFEYNDNNK